MGEIIAVENLSKSYGPIQAVDDIGFAVGEGQLFAFLGPNGAGKSTAIDIMCTFLKPDAGTVTINGFTLGQQDDSIRASIGAVFQSGMLDDLLSVEENLRARGSLYGHSGEALAEAVHKAAGATGISNIMKRRYGTLSGGQKRRADIARALVNTPKILFLDEPTTGLDPQTRRSVWETVSALQRETGMTIFLTTHYMEEAAEADHVVVIDEGRIVAQGTPAQLKERFAKDTLRLAMSDPVRVSETLAERGVEFQVVADQAIVRLDSTLDALPLVEASLPFIAGFEVLGGTMDEAFIAITGKELRS